LICPLESALAVAATIKRSIAVEAITLEKTAEIEAQPRRASDAIARAIP
jgi:hypothetical protein